MRIGIRHLSKPVHRTPYAGWPEDIVANYGCLYVLNKDGLAVVVRSIELFMFLSIDKNDESTILALWLSFQYLMNSNGMVKSIIIQVNRKMEIRINTYLIKYPNNTIKKLIKPQDVDISSYLEKL